MDSKYGTNFVETEALLAQSSNDEDTVYEILLAMNKTELLKLSRDARELADNARYVAGKK